MFARADGRSPGRATRPGRSVGASQTKPRQTYAAAPAVRRSGRSRQQRDAVGACRRAPDGEHQSRRRRPASDRSRSASSAGVVAGCADDRHLARPVDQRLGDGQPPAGEARVRGASGA